MHLDGPGAGGCWEDPWCWDVARETQKEDFGVMKCLPWPGMRGTVRQQGSQLGSSPLLALFQQGAEP